MNRKRGIRRLAAVVAAAVAPLTAHAEMSAAVGQLLDFVNYRPEPQASFVNAAMCNGEATLQLEWNLAENPLQAGVYTLYASSAAPAAATGSALLLCPTLNDAQLGVMAGPIGSGVQTTPLARNTSVTGPVAVARAGADCTGAYERRVFYICAHYTTGTTVTASAVGTFILQTQEPGAPAIASVVPGPGALAVSWNAPTSFELADHYVLFATRVDTGERVASADITGTSGRITGLLAAQPYEVTVVAYSVGGNPGAPSAPVAATPDAPDAAGDAPAGPERLIRSGGGGCASGGAAAFSLLALAALAVRRRNRATP